MPITVTDVKVFTTAPRRANLIVVKLETSEPGLYGLGCATFTQRHTLIPLAVVDYLKDRMIGRKVDDIEGTWHTLYTDSYWRNGPVLNNAISGVDEALWDIKGKIAGMPVYNLIGGKCREAAAVYRHAQGEDYEDLKQKVQAYLDEGIRYIRVQMGGYGGNMADGQRIISPENALPGSYYDPKQYMRATVEMFRRLREDFGYTVEFCHDTHERLVPIDALQLAKDLEPYKPFFLEDALPPDQVDWFRYLREQTSVPLAMGELFSNQMEWLNLIRNRYIDYIRCHLSDIGGFTPALKLANLCEAFGVRTAWHGPGDLTPIGAAAQLHLDLHCYNFGIQEFAGFSDEEREVFPGAPVMKNGYLYANDRPGWGVDFDEKAAAGYPAAIDPRIWTNSRYTDGTPARP